MDIAEGCRSPRETDASNSISSVSNSSISSPRTSDTDIESLLDTSIDFPLQEKCLESPPNVREAVSEEVRSLLVSVPPEILRGKYTILPGERPKPGLDRSLPPICKIEDIFEDLTAQALKNGFDSFLSHIGTRELRVATMCSGTESPLLALEMIQSSTFSPFPHGSLADYSNYRSSTAYWKNIPPPPSIQCRDRCIQTILHTEELFSRSYF